MIRILHSLPLFWALMLWPAFHVTRGLVQSGWYVPEMLHVSGVWSGILLVLTLSVTPLALLSGRMGHGAIGRWLIRRRRHLGLGAFVYAALHVAHYLRDAGSVRVAVGEAASLDFAAGWIGFALFLAMAVTSNDRSIRALGSRWKALHRWVYPAAGLIFLHWALLLTIESTLIVWAGLLVAAKALHVALRRRSRRVAA
ncbi:ferric reductase-like transmembrane domain-containing protein [Jannaschia sp.]|nr:ferric reductase-like transmembrane domain-containing protein [Jannaschia sp.]